MSHKLRVSVGAVVTLFVLMIFTPMVQATNPGLRVFVYVHNAPIGSEATVSVDGYSKRVTANSELFYVEFNIGKVPVGEQIRGCAHVEGDVLRCDYTYNSKKSSPERIDIYLPVSGGFSGSQAQAQAQSQGQSQSQSQSQSLCLAFCGGGN